MTRLLLLSAALSLLMGCAAQTQPTPSQDEPAPATDVEPDAEEEIDTDADDDEHDGTSCLVDRCPECTDETEEPEAEGDEDGGDH